MAALAGAGLRLATRAAPDGLDRVLAAGVVISGDLVLSIADVDLVYLSLRAVLSSVRAAVPPPDDPAGR